MHDDGGGGGQRVSVRDGGDARLHVHDRVGLHGADQSDQSHSDVPQ